MAWLDEQFSAAWSEDGVFDRLKDTITRYIGGEANDSVEVQASVHWDDEQGTNEAAGEGRQIANQGGLPLLRTCLIEVERSEISDPPLKTNKDKFVLADGDTVVYVRSLGRDGATATLFCQRCESISRKLAHPRP